MGLGFSKIRLSPLLRGFFILRQLRTPNFSQELISLNARSSQDEHRIRNSSDDFSSGLRIALSVHGSVVRAIYDEDWTFTRFSQDTPLPATSDHGRSYGIESADEDSTTIVADQARHMVDEEQSQSVHESITRWLDRPPSTNYVIEETTPETQFTFGSPSEESFRHSVSVDEVNIVLARRDVSLFRATSQGDWQLHRPSEVQDEARTRRSSSQSSRGSNRRPRRVRRRLAEIDSDVVEKLIGFSFTSARWERKLSRPYSRPVGPRALARRQQPCISHVQATMRPSSNPAHGLRLLEGEGSEASRSQLSQESGLRARISY